MALLRRAVLAAFAQDHPGPVEVVVVFDQCEPQELDIPERDGRTLRVVRNTSTPGLAGARNSGIAVATGEYVAFCDDDDEWLPGKLRAQLDLLARHPDSFAAATGIEVRSGDASVTRLVPHAAVGFRDLLRDRIMELHPSTLLVRRDVLVERVGPVDEKLPGSYAEDYDLLLRIARIAPIACVPEALTVVHWGNSFFADRFPTIADALTYLLDKHPEFATEPAGRARIEGQIAFFRAAAGDLAEGRRWARTTLRHSWREPRAYLALAMGARVLTARRVLRTLNARGRGV